MTGHIEAGVSWGLGEGLVTEAGGLGGREGGDPRMSGDLNMGDTGEDV